MADSIERTLDRLRIETPRNVEIESKRRAHPDQEDALRAVILKTKGVRHKKAAIFFDQYLDTPNMAIFRLGASLRIRYKGDGTRVYIQYKGPGFHTRGGLLVRSEFSSGRLDGVVLEESHHDMIQFSEASIQNLLSERLPIEMRRAMRRHLGVGVIRKISRGPILSIYKKDKFLIRANGVEMEPSLDRVFAFHINKTGLHPGTSFCEYENEVKALDLQAMMPHLDEILAFDAKLLKKFDLPLERLDKYHRCNSFFLPNWKFRPRRKVPKRKKR